MDWPENIGVYILYYIVAKFYHPQGIGSKQEQVAIQQFYDSSVIDYNMRHITRYRLNLFKFS